MKQPRGNGPPDGLKVPLRRGPKGLGMSGSPASAWEGSPLGNVDTVKATGGGGAALRGWRMSQGGGRREELAAPASRGAEPRE